MISLKKISERINGELKGDPGFMVESVNSLERAKCNEIAFCVKESVDETKIKAGALIVGRESKVVYPNLVFVDNPYEAFAALLEFFFPGRRFNDAVDPNAYIAPTAVIGKNVSIGIFSYVGENSVIGDNCQIHSGVTIYHNVSIGKNCLVYSNVVIREDVEIGENVTIQPGVVIGADGFGFTRLPDGTPVKIPQKGKVIIKSNCEIGANTCIDRSTIEETVLGEYVKLDNLVQVGHNVRIGKKTAISAQTGIAGSTTIGENVIMGGQVGIADHLTIADNVILAAKSGVRGSIKKSGSVIAGYPSQEIEQWRMSYVILRNIRQYVDRIKELEKKVTQLEIKNLTNTED